MLVGLVRRWMIRLFLCRVMMRLVNVRWVIRVVVLFTLILLLLLVWRLMLFCLWRMWYEGSHSRLCCYLGGCYWCGWVVDCWWY